jgi:hypothetical protein
LLIRNNFGSVPFSWCRVECERRRAAKLIQSSLSGSKCGWMHRCRTLSGRSGVTIRSLGNTHPSLFPSGSAAIQDVSRSKISGPTPTSRTASVLVGLINVALVPRPLNSDRSVLEEIAVFQSINLRFSQPAERHKAKRQSLPLGDNSPRSRSLRQRYTTEARTIRPPRRLGRLQARGNVGR